MKMPDASSPATTESPAETGAPATTAAPVTTEATTVNPYLPKETTDESEGSANEPLLLLSVRFRTGKKSYQ